MLVGIEDVENGAKWRAARNDGPKPAAAVCFAHPASDSIDFHRSFANIN